MALAHPLDKAAKAPVADDLPLESDGETSTKSESAHDSDSDEPVPHPQDRLGDDPGAFRSDNEDDEDPAARYPARPLRNCGRLPFACDPRQFLERPANVEKTRRSAEANYSREYDRLARNVGIAAPSAVSQGRVVLEKETSPCTITSSALLDLQVPHPR